MQRKKFLNRSPLLLITTLFVLTCVFAAAEPQPKLENLNVFAVVSENIEQNFIQAAELLKKEQQLEAFPLKGYQIHCTLYMTMYPENSAEKVMAKIASLASNTSRFEVSTSGLEITSGNWFFMNLERNRNLQALADEVVRILSPLRADSDFIPEWAKSFPNKVEYIKKYGSPNVLKEFNPHLTFLAPVDRNKLEHFVKDHENSPFAKKISGQIVGIGAGLAGRSGQIKKALKIFPLRQPDEE